MGILLFVIFAGLVGVLLFIVWQFAWAATPYTIKHWLLGWHYVRYTDSATSFNARVVKAPNGRLMMKGGFCRGHYDDFIMGDLTLRKKGHIKLEPLTWDEI